MCGIAGYIGKKRIDKHLINHTLGLMKNRGPDNQSANDFQTNDIYVYLLHSRLSIIDMNERSNQPFRNKNHSLIFNGEIYNYIELRNDLKKKGHHFRTNSDTEVLIKSYEEYGQKCVQYFNGMWSFAIWDENERVLFLSRDRFGEKPLFIYQTNHGLYFGSEIKFIQSLSKNKTEINLSMLTNYLGLGYKSLNKKNQTFFKQVFQLGYGTNLLVNNKLNIKKNRYWEPVYSPDKKINIHDAIEGTREHLLNSMKIRLRSDAPMAFCLSGGIDSSSLVSIAKKHFNYSVNTFSIIDKDIRYNEKENIINTIEDNGCGSNLIELGYDNMINRLENLVEYHDSPISTISYLIHSMLSEKISEQDIRVAFSGTGADEIFTGYYDHFLLHLNEIKQDKSLFIKNLNFWKSDINPLISNPMIKDSHLFINNPKFRGHIYDDSDIFSKYLTNPINTNFNEECYTPNLMRNRMLNEMFHEITPVILHEDDLNSMYYSIENRSPYLDPALFDFAYKIPGKFLINNGFSKFILRQAMKGILNDKVRLDRTKKGFNTSFYSIFNIDDKNFYDYLLDPSSDIFQIINRNMIKELFNNRNTKNSYSKFLFNFINSKIFLDQN
ncbi:MAG: asparagine synthase (glutamine-hydrolyzing) [Candidatus Marinimicrobia bacterium]|nr:asparagine synthase (glutamine-hydrolyzing) [Candidatus Neomarinimicrobiota bacterium]